jgi:hypothetical protein
MSEATARPANTIQNSLKNVNEFLVGIGVFMVVFCIICTLLEVQTSEAMLMHGGLAQLTRPDLATFVQLLDLVQGKLAPFQIIVVIWGWGSQITYFACIVGYNHFHKSLARHNKWLAGICCAIAALVTIYNMVSDYNYVGLVINDFWWQMALTSVIALGAGAFGIAGIHFIKAGFGKE